MKMLLLSAAFALAVIAPGLAAQKVTDQTTGFEVQFPDKWKIGKLSTMSVPHIAGAFEQDAERAVCIVSAQEMPNTKGLTQTEMNKNLRTPLGRDFWLTRVYGTLNNVTFEGDGVRDHPSGVVVQEAEVTAGGPGAASAIRLHLISTFIATPGMTYNSACSTYPQAFEKYRPIFRAIIDSFRPGQPGLSASINPPPGSAPGAAVIVPAAQSPGGAGDMFGTSAQDGVLILFTKPEITK